MATNSIVKVGRRKTSTARVFITQGSGKIFVNSKDPKKFFSTETLHQMAIAPLKVTNTMGSFDVHVNVNGGGINGQAGAIQLGLARALVESNEDHRSVLRQHGYLTRDPRMVERKKYGRPKARKRFQFSKR